jgi:hypothetical protein
MIHEYLRWKPKPRIQEEESLPYDENFAMQLLRMKGDKAYNDYLNLFVPPEEEVLPKLLIFKDCKVVIDAIKACSYDKVKIEDIAEFDGDDPIDGLRYIVDAADSYVRLSMNTMKEMNRREDIEARLRDSSNFAGYYMGMRQLEAETGKMTGVKRYKRH